MQSVKTCKNMAEIASSRRTVWLDEEVFLALFSIWGEEKVQEELDGAVRNKAVFENLHGRWLR